MAENLNIRIGKTFYSQEMKDIGQLSIQSKIAVSPATHKIDIFKCVTDEIKRIGPITRIIIVMVIIIII